jgi:hypothetical protein
VEANDALIGPKVEQFRKVQIWGDRHVTRLGV